MFTLSVGRSTFKSVLKIEIIDSLYLFRCPRTKRKSTTRETFVWPALRVAETNSSVVQTQMLTLNVEGKELMLLSAKQS